jgi:hypothetical protein
MSADGLGTVAGLPRLRRLCLRGGNITDDGLRSLEGMTGLKELDLCDCRNVTEEGVARLRKALPGCAVRNLR